MYNHRKPGAMAYRPPHLILNETWYFISAHIAGELPLLCTDQHKSIWCEVFESLQMRFDVRIAAWVLLDNHYHFLIYFQNAGNLPEFMKHLHGETSFKLNQLDGTQGRMVWYSYWDRFVRDEKDYWTKFNYIHYNPVKHGYVEKAEEWHYSSYRDILEVEGEDWVDDVWASYPVVEFDFET
jgi:putative transposase